MQVASLAKNSITKAVVEVILIPVVRSLSVLMRLSIFFLTFSK